MKVPPDQTAEAANLLSVRRNQAQIMLEEFWIFLELSRYPPKTSLALLELFLHIMISHFRLILGCHCSEVSASRIPIFSKVS